MVTFVYSKNEFQIKYPIMNEDIVCLLQDLGKETSVDVIANFIIRNPETEDLIAAKMGSLLSTTEQIPSTENQPIPTSNPSQSSFFQDAFSLAWANLSNCSFKMIFVVNMDLNMGRGKQCAQVAHASLGLYLQIQESGSEEEKMRVQSWISMGQKKIVVRGNNLQHMKTIQEEASRANLPNFFVTDAGCTQIAPGSKTVLAIFGESEQLDKITGSLRLL